MDDKNDGIISFIFNKALILLLYLYLHLYILYSSYIFSHLPNLYHCYNK